MAWNRRLAQAAFVGYTGALLVATHWPRLTIGGPVDRTDLILHVFAFGLWTVLLGMSGLVGRRWGLLLACGLAYAVMDESTQPPFERTFDPLDLAADGFGIGLGTLAMAWAWRRSARKTGPRAGETA